MPYFMFRVTRKTAEEIERFDPFFAGSREQYDLKKSYWFVCCVTNRESVPYLWLDNCCHGDIIPGFDGTHYFLDEILELPGKPEGCKILEPDYEFHNFLSSKGVIPT
jgi:hypothetical protein